MKPRGKHSPVTPEELQRITEMKRTTTARQIAKLIGRSISVVVYADKPRPIKEADLFFNYKQNKNWLI